MCDFVTAQEILLCLCTVVTLCASLSACSHKCEFSTEWSKDASAHWHACTKEDCPEIADKADHVWDEGEITTEATQEADGVKTFTCTACAQTKTEAVAFTGLSKEAWNAALDTAVFENFTYTETATTTGSGVSVNTETIYKFTKDTAWAKVTMAEQSQESYAPDKASANELRTQLVDSIKKMAPYAKYEYDTTTKTYKATEKIKIDA